jgi:Leucine-rich repeat (LRR) protein
MMPRLTSLLLANNRVSKIDAGVAKYLPNLDTLVLSGNRIESMSGIDGLAGFSNLKYLSLIDVFRLASNTS